MNQDNNKKELFDEQDKQIFKAAGGIGAVWIGILIAIFVVPMIVFAILFFVVFNKVDKLAKEQISNNNQANVQEETKTSYVGKYVYSRKECSDTNACKNVESVFEIIDDKNAKFDEYTLYTVDYYKGTYKVEDEYLYFYALEKGDGEGNYEKIEKDETNDPEKDAYMIFTINEGNLVFGMDPPLNLYEKK